jgi:SagB-type dehydrogenase family enzyme
LLKSTSASARLPESARADHSLVPADRARVKAYHDRTKHHFHRFAPSLGYLDWATQPDPFRRYAGARIIRLSRERCAADVHYQDLYRVGRSPAPLTAEALADCLRCSLGLSAWKQYGRNRQAEARWSLRVNPSSGNLHPTEAYVITGLPGVVGERDAVAVCHYAPRDHVLEERCRIARDRFIDVDWSTTFFVALSSIYWREAWKYGERAFRYCQHDAGHAIGAVRLAASLFGWNCALQPGWSDTHIATLCGLPREAGVAAIEPEVGECLLLVTTSKTERCRVNAERLVDEFSRGTWQGIPNRLSPTRVEWHAIEEVAEATICPATHPTSSSQHRGTASLVVSEDHDRPLTGPPARDVILRRRSALGFDQQGRLPRATCGAMLQRLVPGQPPWDALWWEPQVHLVLFVHRVDGLVPGIYAFLRDPQAREPLASAMREEFLWEPVAGIEGLHLLVPLDCRDISRRISCDQDIAADGFFGISMLARFDAALDQRGAWFYRHLFWECGVIGQVLYLESEAAGARATGIGCFYDDPTHELLGLSGHTWQSLYHFSAGMPVEDARLTTEPGYDWEDSHRPQPSTSSDSPSSRSV